MHQKTHIASKKQTKTESQSFTSVFRGQCDHLKKCSTCIRITSFCSFSSTSSLSFSSVAQWCPTLATQQTAARQASLSITNIQSPPKPISSIVLVMPSNHLILCHPLLLLPSIFPSIRVFSNESALHIRWPKYWHFNFNISPSSEHPGRISFRMDSLDLLEVQGTLKSLIQHHSSKASILLCSAFFSPTVTSIHDHWKNHSLD